MKHLIIFLALTTSALASTAKFEMTFDVKSLSTDEIVAQFDCTVTQTLTWENSSNFFKCINAKGELLTVMNVAVTMGYDYERSKAYTIHETVGKRGLVSMLFEKMGMDSKFVRGAGIKVYYMNKYPAATSAEYMIEGSDDAFSVVLHDLNYLD